MSKEFETLLAEYGPLLSRVAASYEANADLQQELVQEMSLAVWQALKAFRGQSSLKTYILRIAHNRAVNHVSYHAKQPRRESYCEVQAPSADQGHSPDKAAAMTQQIDSLVAAVRALPIQVRQVMTLSLEGLSYQEIADVSGLTVNNVGVTLNRAKKVLTEKMQHDG